MMTYTQKEFKCCMNKWMDEWMHEQKMNEWTQELSSMSNGRMMIENIKRIGRKWENKLNMLGERR